MAGQAVLTVDVRMRSHAKRTARSSCTWQSQQPGSSDTCQAQMRLPVLDYSSWKAFPGLSLEYINHTIAET